MSMNKPIRVIVRLANTVYLDDDGEEVAIPAGTQGVVTIDTPILFEGFEEWYIDGVELEVVRVEAD